jgi:subtilisin
MADFARSRSSGRPAVVACAVAVALLVASHEQSTILSAEGGPTHYIVAFRAGTNAPGRARAVANAGGVVRFNYNGVNAAAVVVPNERALAALESDPSVLAIVPDRLVSAYPAASAKSKPGGGGGSSQVVPAGVARVGVPTSSSNGDGVGVAIVDTGIDLTHADLGSPIDAFSAYGGSCADDEGHGTHVSGIVAARDNAIDVVGVAPHAQLYCVKVLDSTGSGTDASVMAGLDWVLANHALVAPPIRVVNMSLGRPGAVDDNPSFHDLIRSLEAAGVAVVVAAGNDASVEISQQIPAAYAEVIAVASTTATAGSNQCRLLNSPIGADTASYFTTDGAGVAVSAPGEDAENVSRGCLISSTGILSTRLGGGTTRMSGTSMATPHVSGVLARHFQANSAFTVADIRQFLVLDAARAGTAPLDSPTSSYSFDGVREGIVQAP